MKIKYSEIRIISETKEINKIFSKLFTLFNFDIYFFKYFKSLITDDISKLDIKIKYNLSDIELFNKTLSKILSKYSVNIKYLKDIEGF